MKILKIFLKSQTRLVKWMKLHTEPSVHFPKNFIVYTVGMVQPIN